MSGSRQSFEKFANSDDCKLVTGYCGHAITLLPTGNEYSVTYSAKSEVVLQDTMQHPELHHPREPSQGEMLAIGSSEHREKLVPSPQCEPGREGP